MNISAMFRSAVEEFDARVRLIGDHQWQAATPDQDWSVRDLVNHVVSEDLWAPPLLAGSTIAEMGDRFDGDVLGGDPKAAWAAASAGAVQAVGEDGAMDRIVHLSFGDFPGRDYALQLFADHLIHAWDLARAIGSDERLDAMLVASCATWFDAVEDTYRSTGAIAPRPPVPGDADAQTVLLARFGRSAWGQTGRRAWRTTSSQRVQLEDGRMLTDDPLLDLMDRFTVALNSHDLDAVAALVTDDIVFESTSPPPDGTRYEGRDAVCQIWGQMLAATPQARFSVEEQFSDGSGRAVVRWRYDWADGHVRGVDIVRVRNGQLAESLAYVKG